MDFLMNLGEGSQFAIQLAIVLICLFYGAKKGGIALGMLGGVGLIVLVFGFGIEPGKPAIDVMLTILAVVVTSATLQASGGLDVMLQIAEKMLRRNPKYVSILAPFVTCFLTILCGTGHGFIPCYQSFMISRSKMIFVLNVQWQQVQSLLKWVSLRHPFQWQ